MVETKQTGVEPKQTGVQLTPEYRAKLERIVKVNKRTIKGQVEAWIDEEIRIIERSGK